MKKILFLLFTISWSLTAFAQSEITEKQAQNLASSFVKSNSSLRDASLTLVRASKVYVYNVADQGFVMVSGDKVLPPILGYSFSGTFVDLDVAPDNIVSWVKRYDEMIDYAKERQLQPEAAVLSQWEKALQGDFGFRDGKSVDPLVATRWNQDCYYNEYCPYTGGGGWWDDGGPCGHAYAGCVACAMAQVMKYWNHPHQGFGSHSYVHGTYGEQSADFGNTVYNWIQMPNYIYGSNSAIATLMYHCGVSVNMNYAPDGSGAQSRDVEHALRSYFGYCGAKYREKRNYDEQTWMDMLRAELDLSHPLYYSGSSTSVGHAFVCDGYDGDYFHFNFGWSGAGDSFYSLYDVNGYSDNQAAVFNIVPMDIRADEDGIIHVSADGEGNGSSWEQATPHLEFASYLSSGGNTRVWVKKGVYYGDETEPENAFSISASNKIYGGFNGDEPADYDLSQRDFVNNATILDGQGAKRVLNQDVLLNSGSRALWDGFTIRNGKAGSGAGAYINGYVDLANCSFEGNVADAFGGGVYVNSSSSNNQVNITNCRFTGNTASMGGGLCDRNGINITNCIISNNIATTKGGGIYTYNNATPVLRGCIISNNSAKDGGGIFSKGKIRVFNSDIVMNEATQSSGGTYNENHLSSYTSCILWGNIANGTPHQNTGQCGFQYCAIQGVIEGEGNITVPADNNGEEPGVYLRFNQPAEGPGSTFTGADWRVSPRSICLNAGNPGSAGYNTDLNGNARMQHGRVDIGAYERNASLTLVEATIWEDETYWLNNRPLTEPGYYTTVYPTPSCDSVVGLTLQVTLGSEEFQDENAGEILSIEVYSLLGQRIATLESEDELRGYKTGCYLLRIHTTQGIQTKKVIIP